jgi:hypothetical protein
MDPTLNFLLTKGGELVTVIAAVHTICLFIVNLTPSKTDNEVYNRFYRYIEFGAGLLTKLAKK